MSHLKPAWESYKSEFNSKLTTDELKEAFPFKAFVTYKMQEAGSEDLVDIFKTTASKTGDKKALVKCLDAHWKTICDMFTRVARLAALETIRDERQRADYIVNVHA